MLQDVFVHPTAEVSRMANLGFGTKVWNHSQIREEAIIGRNCIIGKNVYIDSGVRIGNHVKIQNGVNVYRGVTVEDDVFLGPNMTFTNDLYPRAFNNQWRVTKTVIKKGASIGANATIVCGVCINEYSLVAAGSVVTKDVPPYTLVAGNPARIIGKVCKCGQPLNNHMDEYCCGK